MSNADSYTWIKASAKGANVRVKVNVHSKYSQNNGLYELVVAEQKVQNYLFDLGLEIVLNRSHWLGLDSHNTRRSTDTTFADEDAAAAVAEFINTTKWDDIPTPSEITGVRFVDTLPKVEKSPAFPVPSDMDDDFDL